MRSVVDILYSVSIFSFESRRYYSIKNSVRKTIFHNTTRRKHHIKNETIHTRSCGFTTKMSSTPSATATDQSSSSEKYYLAKSTDPMGSMDRNFNNNMTIDTHNLWKYNKHPHQQHHLQQQQHHHHQHQQHHHHQQLMQSYNNISNGIASDSSNVIGNNSQQMLSGVHQRLQQPLSATTESGVGRQRDIESSVCSGNALKYWNCVFV